MEVDTERIIQNTLVVSVEHHPQLGSTNDRARQCALAGTAPLPRLILADEQTAGRGRGSNRWWTGRAGLAFSLLLGPDALATGRTQAPLVALSAAVAVAETVRPLLPPRRVGIHWPNDVFVDGRKLAGVLVEVVSGRSLVVGIGLNSNNTVRDAPTELQHTATTLRDMTDARHDHTLLLISILHHLDRLLQTLESGDPRITERANALCLQTGRWLTIRSADRSTSGVCAGIAPDGALVLDTDGGRERFYSGTVG